MAAAAYFNQTLNRQPQNINNNNNNNNNNYKEKALNFISNNSNNSIINNNNINNNRLQSHHSHHHQSKRAKYSSPFKSSTEINHNNINNTSSSRSNSANNSSINHRESSNQQQTSSNSIQQSSITNLNNSINQNASKNNNNNNNITINSVNYLKCIQVDSDTSPLFDTMLHGEKISCFVVGGEKRLCLHDILNTILKEFSVQQINSACQKLQIACLEACPKQLDILKKQQLIPAGAPNCGLLTQTNAERLCAYLMDNTLSQPGPPAPPPSKSPTDGKLLSPASSPNGNSSRPGKNTLKVVHECFGKTYGHIHMHMYSRSDSACVECDTCRKLYTPKNFVCHSHKLESHTRHWGFDSANWRIYLKLAQHSHNTAENLNNTSNSSNSNNNKNNNNILSDIKVSNKDNIAANNKYTQAQEEFEQFKKKFLNNNNLSKETSSNGLLDIQQHHNFEVLKRKMVNTKLL